MIWALLAMVAFAAPVRGLDVLTGARAEVPLERGTWLVPIALAPKDGEPGTVVLVRGGGEVTEVTWYDEALAPVDAMLLEVPRNIRLVDWHRDGDAVFLLFDARGGSEVIVAEIPVQPGEVGLQVFLANRRVDPRQIVVDGHDVYVRGANHGAAVILHGTAGDDDEMRLMQDPMLPRKVGLQRLVEADGSGVDVVVHDLRRRRRTSWLMHGEGPTLTMVQEVAPGEGEPNLVSAQWIDVPDGRLVVGTYAPGPRSLGAQGLYVARYTDSHRDWLRTHSFAEIEGFFSYLSERGEARIERRAGRLKEAGQELKVGLQLVLHDLERTPGGVLLVGEAVVPVYRTETRTETSVVNGRTVTRTVTRQVFVGYQHTHAFASELSVDGELVWSHSFEMGGRLYPTKRERVAVGVEDDGVTLRFTVGARVISKSIHHGEADRDREEARLIDGDVLAAWQTGAAPWGSAFLLWGREKVASERGRRKVFFLARVED